MKQSPAFLSMESAGSSQVDTKVLEAMHSFHGGPDIKEGVVPPMLLFTVSYHILSLAGVQEEVVFLSFCSTFNGFVYSLFKLLEY